MLVAATLLSSCALPGVAQPWDVPVEGARTVTGWIVEPNPGAEGEVFDSPDAVIEAMRGVEMGIWASAAADVTVGYVGDQAEGMVVGYVRSTFPARSHAMRGVEVRFEIRDGAGGWTIADAERRFHCASDTASELCE